MIVWLVCQLLEAQSDYHRSAVESLEQVLPKVRHHFGAFACVWSWMCCRTVAHKCQPLSKDLAHHTNTNCATLHFEMQCGVSTRKVVWCALWCLCGVNSLRSQSRRRKGRLWWEEFAENGYKRGMKHERVKGGWMMRVVSK